MIVCKNERKDMKNLIKTTLTVMLLGSTSLYSHSHSHGGGDHHAKELSEKKIEAIADKQVKHLIEEKVIDKSWSDITKDKMEKKKFNKTFEWVVSYKNSKITDEAKQTLYIFIGLTGKIIASNYTGE